MNKLRWVYAFTSILFLIILSVSPLKDYFSEWRITQQEFNQYIAKWPQKVKPVSIGLKQIWASDLDRVDRCVSCHVGIDNDKLVGADQPFSTHPDIEHGFEKFGCTICHGGQGLATTFEEAHEQTEFWDEPVLPAKFTQSRCASCHIEQKLVQTPEANKGIKLISEFNCAACHDIPAMEKSYTPTLDGIGKKLKNRSWLVRWLTNPSESELNTRMPNFDLLEGEIEVLADFLMSFTSFPQNAQIEPLPEIYLKFKDDDDFINLGKTRFREARCISCHLIDGRGGRLAPDLVKIASKAKPEWIYNFLKNPKRFQPEVEMPQFGFSEEELAAVTAYITSEFIDWMNRKKQKKQKSLQLIFMNTD